MKFNTSTRRLKAAVSLAALSGFWCADGYAGSHKNQAAQFVPIYLQQAPAVQVYSAPVAQVYAAPAVQMYSAPAVQMYSAPAPQMYSAPVAQAYSAPAAQAYSAPAAQAYSAPAVQMYSAPAPQMYSAPANYYTASAIAAGTTTVGNAPVAGAKISVVDREDILADLRREAKEGASDGTMRERRKALRESARTKYADSIGVDESELGDADNQDIEIVVNSILNPNSGNAMQSVAVQSALQPVSYLPSYAPVYAPQQPTMLVQPVVPAQLYVPVQPKHHWLHK
ncbi:hypothetical protein [Singulisphaera acidiphila]|uniref:Uncharacterized protein n=1 Tax=Singulisphaera acidiphila (strain ATCC BAA-1392 / DSM 18658 / VKM B-2454 / MOB10) TaxID=886293 RepID=L0DAV8_SINAD|nr:hypothetical protein [Singulisphaera acidiphila]AGA25990.1 hypothetical protein Sinac_1611 [Singulisphaera acidiphila DSM 18658]